MTTPDLTLAISAMYDTNMQAVGIEVHASDAFETLEHTRELLEILATINAQANQIASEVINEYSEDDSQKRALLEHYASLKEQILENMIKDDQADPPTTE